MSDVISTLRGGLIVSCQAYPGEPMLEADTMTQVAQSAVIGGAVGIRAKGIDHLTMMRPVIDVPIIGIVKIGHDGVFITPTLADCRAVADTGCEIVALDGTRRERPDGLTLAQTIAGVKDTHPDVLTMADCGSLGDAEAAMEAGFDLIGTTLVGYTGERPMTDGPDWEEIGRIIAAADRPVVVEGRIHTPAQAAQAMELGATTVVVGTAITHPASLTRWFAQAMAQ